METLNKSYSKVQLSLALTFFSLPLTYCKYMFYVNQTLLSKILKFVVLT